MKHLFISPYGSAINLSTDQQKSLVFVKQGDAVAHEATALPHHNSQLFAYTLFWILYFC